MPKWWSTVVTVAKLVLVIFRGGGDGGGAPKPPSAAIPAVLVLAAFTMGCATGATVVKVLTGAAAGVLVVDQVVSHETPSAARPVTPSPSAEPREAATQTPPAATETPAPHATETPASSPRPRPAFNPPAYCFSNGGAGKLDKNGEPQFTAVNKNRHELKIDFTWWLDMGTAWAEQYACGGPRGNPAPNCWGGGRCSPCDPSHKAALDGPCAGVEWASRAHVGTLTTFSGPGYAGTQHADEANPFADVWMAYHPGRLPVHAVYCPPADMIDRTTGLEIPRAPDLHLPNVRMVDGCRVLDFVTPSE